MSLSKSKAFLTGVLLAVLLAVTGSAMALDGMRLWKPYQAESFDGGRRSGDGFFVGIDAIFWKIDGPKGLPVGYRNPDGSSAERWAYDGNKTYLQTNSVSTSALNTDFTLGTRLEVGNRRGHHGWLFSGYGLSDVNANYRAENGTMVIRDPENLTTYGIYGSDFAFNEVWQPDGTFKTIPETPPMTSWLTGNPQVPIRNAGYLWAWYPIHWDDPWTEGRLAPIPLTFARFNISNSVDIMSLELNYTYRPHPFKWGEMEFLAGARHWDFDDKFTFLGQGFEEPFYSSDPFADNNDNNNDNEDGWGEPGNSNSNVFGPFTAVADTKIVGHVRNRITGPQVGVRFQRRNARWTFGAEGRFMAGINGQSQTVSGYIGSNFINPQLVPRVDVYEVSGDGSNGGNETINNHGILPYIPLGLHHNTQTFYHHRVKTIFSPGVELQMSAKWQWTDAVGVKLGFNSTIFDNIGRGADVIQYSISDNGTLFGLRTTKTAVITYGVNFGLDVRR